MAASCCYATFSRRLPKFRGENAYSGKFFCYSALLKPEIVRVRTFANEVLFPWIQNPTGINFAGVFYNHHD